MPIPYTFADKTGRVPAEYLDANFAYVSDAQNLSVAMQGPSLAWLKALVIPTGVLSVITQHRATAGDGGGGTWVWRSGDQSVNVTADPQSGVWAAPASASTGASGAWQRLWDSTITPEWWGIVGDNATDNYAGFMSMFGFMSTLGTSTRAAATVVFGSGLYRTSPVTTDVVGCNIEGVSPFATSIRAVSATGQSHVWYFTARGTFNISNLEFFGNPSVANDPTKFANYGLVLEFATNGRVADCRFWRCRNGFAVRHGNTLLIDGCKGGLFDQYGLKMGSVNDTINTLTAATYSSGTMTFTFTDPTGFIVGTPVPVEGCTPSGFNGTWYASEILSSTSARVRLINGDAIPDPGGPITVLGQVDNSAGGLGECVVSDCDFYSGATAWGVDYAGTAVGLCSGNTHTTLINIRGGSLIYGFHGVDDLGRGDTTAPGFVEFYFCAPGRVSGAGYYLENGGNSWELNGCKVTGIEPASVGFLLASPTGAPQFYGCDIRNCGASGISVTDGYSLTVHSSDFHKLGVTGTNAIAGIDLISGSAIVTVEGCYFNNNLQDPLTFNMDYGVVLQTGFAGSCLIDNSTAVSPAIGDWVNLSASGGTLEVRTAKVIDVSTSDTALRVTQRGTGYAMRVEDSATPDTTPFAIDGTGKVLTGRDTATTFSGGVIPRLQGLGTGSGETTWGIYSGANGVVEGPVLEFFRARGNTVGYTAVIDGSGLGVIPFSGADGTAAIRAASIRAEVDGTPGTNDMPGRLIFSTTLDGAAAVTDRWQIGNAGMLRALSGSLGRGAPVTKTADFTVATSENWLINNKSGSSCTVTLPSASAFPGREIMITNYQAQTVISASSNVVPLGGGAAATAILSANAGRWCTLVSDGTNWVITSGVI